MGVCFEYVQFYIINETECRETPVLIKHKCLVTRSGFSHYRKDLWETNAAVQYIV